MKKKEIDPFDWDRISIEKYYEIMDILNDEVDDDITKNVKLVATILDKDEKEIWDMDLTEVGGYIGRLQFLNKFDIDEHPTKRIKLPSYDLVVMKDLSKINVAQYVDYQNFITLPLREGMDKILSIFLIPEGKTYNTDYDILDVQKEIRQSMSFRVAEGLLGFFLKRYGELLVHSLGYCRKKMMKTKNQEEKEELEKKTQQLVKTLKDLTVLVGCS